MTRLQLSTSLVTIFFFGALVLRPLLHRLRTGAWGIHGLSGTPREAGWWGGAAFIASLVLTPLALMMPLLALYANALGIIGGMVVAAGLLDIPPAAYWVEMLTVVTTTDIWVGLIKAGTFGLIIGLAGCLRGLQAERSAAGVGHAATSAVVTAILFITIADAIFAVLFNAVGW